MFEGPRRYLEQAIVELKNDDIKPSDNVWVKNKATIYQGNLTSMQEESRYKYQLRRLLWLFY